MQEGAKGDLLAIGHRVTARTNLRRGQREGYP